jgi:ribosome biogenesis GTPase
VKREARTGSRVVIGDRVRVEDSGTGWTIESVEERTSELVRRGRSGRAAKILAANLDRVFVIVALREPAASTQLIDRLLVLVESGGMRPTLVLNKADLDEAEAAADRYVPLYEGVGYDVLVTSAQTGRGAPELHQAICGHLSAFIGPSGAGKSTLLNAIDPTLDLRTGGLSRKTGTGRHTTVGSRLIPLACGGFVADTPGFGDVGLWSVPPDEVADCFPEFRDPSDSCRFRGCSHVHEPDCAVLAAVANGSIRASRHENYVILRDESKADTPY